MGRPSAAAGKTVSAAVVRNTIPSGDQHPRANGVSERFPAVRRPEGDESP
jgi:hypothetical protein